MPPARKSRSKSPTRKSKSPSPLPYDPSMKWGNYMYEENLRHPSRGREIAARLAAIEAQKPRSPSPAAEMRKWNKTHKSPPKKRAASPKRSASPKAKPRKCKVMRECKADATGCERHMKQGDCKFCHRDEPEWAMLRPDQKIAKGGRRTRKA